MERKRINMKKIRGIIRLKETSELSERQIVKALNISRPAPMPFGLTPMPFELCRPDTDAFLG